MLQPTQAELDARERARQAGRASAQAAQAHTPTSEDQPPADPGPLATRVEILKPDPEPVLDPQATQHVAAEDRGPFPAKPQPGGMPTAEWLNRLARYYHAAHVGPTPASPPLEGHHRVLWTVGDVGGSADFPTVNGARGFQLDASAGAGVTVHLVAKSTGEPESAAVGGTEGSGGATTPEDPENPSTGEKTAFVAVGGPAFARGAALAQMRGAYRAGDRYRSGAREAGHFRVEWRGATDTPGKARGSFFADFVDYADAHGFALVLQRDARELDADRITLAGDDLPDEPGETTPDEDGLSALLGGDFMDELLKAAMGAELARQHRQLKRQGRQLAAWKWAALVASLAALCFGAAAVSLAVALRYGVVGVGG